jgi:hypothetical protein
MAGSRKGRGIQRGHQEATAEYRRSKDPQGKGKSLGSYLNKGVCETCGQKMPGKAVKSFEK